METILSIAPAVVLALVMAVAWAVAMRTGNGGWADAFWSLGVGVAGVVAALGVPVASASPSARPLLVAVLAALWSLRLGAHIWSRSGGESEDPRYAELRRTWGASHASRLFWFLQLQAFMALPLVAAIGLAARRPGTGIDSADVIGALVVLAGVTGEGIADRQLARFRADPAHKGQLCDTGLWAWSRHPNYFFEWVCWWAWPIIAIGFAGSYPWGVLALGAPAIMYWLLVHVSGLPPLEAHLEKSRGAAFAAYKARTPAFFPAPPGWYHAG